MAIEFRENFFSHQSTPKCQLLTTNGRLRLDHVFEQTSSTVLRILIAGLSGEDITHEKDLLENRLQDLRPLFLK